MRHRTIVVGLGVGVAVTLLGLSVMGRLGLLALLPNRPDGHTFWLVSRAAGITAYVALTLATAWGLLLSTALADTLVARGRSVEVHRWLSSAVLALSAAHVLVLLGDRYVSFDVLDLVVPLLAPYRPEAVAAGIVALYLMVAVYGSFWLRGRIGMRGWRAVHLLSFPAFGLVTLHGLFAGTDSAAPWLRGLYLGAVLLVGVLTALRLLGRTGPSQGRAAAPAGS